MKMYKLFELRGIIQFNHEKIELSVHIYDPDLVAILIVYILSHFTLSLDDPDKWFITWRL